MLGKYRVVSIVLLSICLASCDQQKNTQESTVQESVQQWNKINPLIFN